MFAKLADDKHQLTVTDVDSFQTEESLRANGFLPYEPSDPPQEPLGHGQYYLAEYYEEDGEIKTRWTVAEQEMPPRVFSKLKLKMALAQAGLLQQFLAVLQGVELVEGSGYMASDAFADAVNLSEANDGFKAAVKAAKDALGVTDDDVERILAASVAD